MIELNEKLVIDADDHQFIVKEKKIIQSGKNKGQETYEVFGYYITLEGALRGAEKLMQRRTARDKNLTMKQLLDEIKKIHEDIFDKCGG